MEQQPSFSIELRRKRRALGLTQDQLSERAGVSIRAITDLERGIVARPRIDTVNLLADGLELSPDERDHWHELRCLDSGNQSARIIQHGSFPVGPNRLIGREDTLDQLLSILREPGSGLVSVTGAGGIGKTRIAIEAANRVASEFQHGCRFIDLVPVQHAASVLPTIASALQLRYSSETDLPDIIRDYLQRRSMLVVLDNLEHVIAAAPDLAKIVSPDHRSRLLVTSRVRLQVVAEQEFPLPAFKLPESTTGHLSRANPAVQLFLDRAQQADPSFRLTDQRLPVVVEICRQLDGLPLAIELAAARSRVLSPEEMLPQIQERMDLLSCSLQDVPHRHRTLRDTIWWSYDLLAPDEQRVLRQLSVFNSSWTLEAAEYVCDSEMVDITSTLIDSNLVERIDPDAPRSRYRMLEMIRQFSHDELKRSEEYHDRQAALARYMCDLARGLVPELLGPDPLSAMEVIDEEMPNIRFALEWSKDHDPELGQELCGALSWYWLRVRGDLTEARRLTEQALRSSTLRATARTRCLGGLSWIAHMQQDSASAEDAAREMLEISRESADTWYTAWSLHLLGRIAYVGNHPEQAAILARESLSLARQINDTWLMGWCFQLLGIAELIAGESESARTYLETSYDTWASIDDEFGMAALSALLGVEKRMSGNDRDALELLQSSLHRYQHLRALWFASNFIAEIVTITARLGKRDLAAQLSGFVEEGWRQTGAGPAPFTRAGYDEAVYRLEDEPGSTSFTALREQGRTMTLDEAVTLVLETGSIDQPDDPQPFTAATPARPRSSRPPSGGSAPASALR